MSKENKDILGFMNLINKHNYAVINGSFKHYKNKSHRLDFENIGNPHINDVLLFRIKNIKTEKQYILYILLNDFGTYELKSFIQFNEEHLDLLKFLAKNGNHKTFLSNYIYTM